MVHADHFALRADHRPSIRRVAGVQDHKSRVVHPAIGIFEGLGEERLQRLEREGRMYSVASAAQLAPDEMVERNSRAASHAGRRQL